MKLIFAIATLSVSAALQASPITSGPDVIDVEYWGTVSESTAAGYAVGDPVHSTMRIDLRTRIQDDEDFAESRGEYGPNVGFRECPRNCGPGATEPSGFVTSPGIRDLGSYVFDNVRVEDAALGNPGDVDRYEVTDEEYGNPDHQYLSIAVSSPFDFITGDELVQAFDFRPGENGGTGRGAFEAFVDGVQSTYVFAIERMRTVPRVCHSTPN